jgi:outer membrane protein TolC
LSDVVVGAAVGILTAELAYWALSRAEIYREAMLDYINIINTLRDVALHRFEEGYTSKSDLLQVESRLSDAEYQLSQAEQRWSVALHNFNILRGADPTEPVELGWSILDEYTLPRRVNVSEFIEQHPDYMVAVAGRESAKCNISLREANYLPRLNLGLFGLWQPKVDAGTLLNGGVMFSLNAPIFHFGERREALRSARSDYRSAELMVDDVVDDIVLNEINGWTNLQSSYQRISAARRSLEIAGENLDISTYSYREGLATILDVLQAQLSWLQIYQNAITAQYDYAVAISSYRYILAQR